MTTLNIAGVFIGKVEDIGGGLCSAVDKRQVDHRLWPQGLGSDEQGDRRYHRGAERALPHYPAEHCTYRRERYPQIDWQAPGFGENLSTFGLDEQQVCIGDIFRWGAALLQVSQPRSPCDRLSQLGSLPQLPQVVQETGRCGWFYRVLKPGFVSAQNRFERIEQPLSVAQAMAYFFHTPLVPEGLRRLQACPARLSGQPLEGVGA